jgi:hypothetical protein
VDYISFLHEAIQFSETDANIYSQTRAKRVGVFYLGTNCNKPFVPGTVLSGSLFTKSHAAEICDETTARRRLHFGRVIMQPDRAWLKVG